MKNFRIGGANLAPPMRPTEWVCAIAPYVFTEQGVAMLSSVLNSERAIKVNIQIMRIYSKMREMLMTNQEILLRLESLEGKITKNDTDIQLIFKYLKQLLTPPEQAKRSRIGFKRQDEEDQP